MEKLDHVDYHLIKQLQDNSRTSLKILANFLGVSIPTVKSRILRLQKLGVIKRFSISLDLQVITNQITVFITLKIILNNVKSIIDNLKLIEEVDEAYITTGATDIVLKVHAPDMITIDKLITEKLSKIEGIKSISSSFIMETIKDSMSLNLKPNVGFRIKCDNCRKVVGENYIVKSRNIFCGNDCLNFFTRKS